MKKLLSRILCITLVFSILSALAGCFEKENYVEEQLDNTEYIEGKIISVEGDQLLKLNPNSYYKKTWGDAVYVRTDHTDKLCKGDEIYVYFDVILRPKNESEPLTIVSTKIGERETNEWAKPVIYLYPEQPTECSVTLDLDGEFTCTYPDYGEDGWQNFTAYPDGTLVFPDGREYYCLYWEGESYSEFDRSKGFCVRGEDTAEFLENALATLGLNPREVNEFIIYWLPLMQSNPYNVISFHTDEYNEKARLNVTPTPDSVLRVFMTFSASEDAVEIEPQALPSFERHGFTVVEWGGTELK